MKFKTLFITSALLSTLILFLPQHGLADAGAEKPLSSSQRQDEKLGSLAQVIEQIDRLESQRSALNTKRERTSIDAEKLEYEKQIKDIGSSIEQMNSDFSEISSGVDLQQLSGNGSSEKLDVGREIQDLLVPLLNEVKRATSRPREMEKLRTNIQRVDERLQSLESGKAKIDLLLTNSQGPLKSRLNKLSIQFNQSIEAFQTEKNILSERLEQRKAQDVSIGDSIQQILQLFFKSRGRNFIVAILLLIVTVIFGNKAKAYILNHQLFSRAKRSIYGKGLLLALSLAIGVFGIFVPIIFLYMVGDWILLTVALLVVIGFLWASKQAFLKFWGQAVLLLNMGPVRESERITIGGIPFNVKNINLYTVLENPALAGGLLRIPIRDLENLRSRRASHKEPWFPTSENDWVVLSDSTFGKVIFQSIEQVRIILLGGATKTYGSADFIQLSPLVLSNGYRISFTFGLDYALQPLILDKIPETMDRAINEALLERDLTSDDFNVKVEFNDAGASSLNLAINVDLPGKCGQQYQQMHRLLQKICVRVCTQKQWSIPFQQMTVHLKQSA